MTVFAPGCVGSCGVLDTRHGQSRQINSLQARGATVRWATEEPQDDAVQHAGAGAHFAAQTLGGTQMCGR